MSDVIKSDRDAAADYSEQALVDRQIDFLEARADEWMQETGVQRMFNAIASVFEGQAPQEIMDRFREKLGVIGRQCHVEGALRVWEEIAAQQRAIGAPLLSGPDDPRLTTTLASSADLCSKLDVAREALAELTQCRDKLAASVNPDPEQVTMTPVRYVVEWLDAVIQGLATIGGNNEQN